MPPISDYGPEMNHALTLLGMLGVAVAAAFFIWLLIGWFGWVPTMVDVFGIVGMRTPASITVGGLLLAAFAFRDY